jgi:hypothetical protein
MLILSSLPFIASIHLFHSFSLSPIQARLQNSTHRPSFSWSSFFSSFFPSHRFRHRFKIRHIVGIFHGWFKRRWHFIFQHLLPVDGGEPDYFFFAFFLQIFSQIHSAFARTILIHNIVCCIFQVITFPHHLHFTISFAPFFR